MNRLFRIGTTYNLPLSLLLVLIFFTTLQADQQAAHQAKVSASIKDRIHSLQITALGLAAKQKVSRNSEILKIRMFTTDEQLAGYQCLTSNAFAYGHWGGELTGDCKKAIDHLKKQNEQSAIVQCVINGQDSEDCSNAYVLQQTSPWSEIKKILPRNIKKSDLTKGYNMYLKDKKQSDLQRKAEMSFLDYKKDKTEEKKKVVTENFSELIKQTCTDPALIVYLTSKALGTITEDFQRSSDPEMNKLSNLVKKYKDRIERQKKKKEAKNPFQIGATKKKSEEAKDDKPEIDEQLVRVRILTDQCFDAVDRTLKALPLDPLAICTYKGAFSPACRTAYHKKPVPKGGSF